VVAQAADEAGGQAFATDYAGRLTTSRRRGSGSRRMTCLIAPRRRAHHRRAGPVHLRAALFDPDIARICCGILLPPDFEGGQEPTFLDCAGPVANPRTRPSTAPRSPSASQVEINEPRTEVAGLFASQPYLTRFTSSMSAEEMTEDPAFAFNPDLLDVSNAHRPPASVSVRRRRVLRLQQRQGRTPSGLLLDYNGGQARRT
jgi:hypothetical protein